MLCGDRAGEDERILADVADQPPDGLARDGLSGTPPIRAVPAVGWTSRIMVRSQVVLPHPDRPATPIVSPWRITIETP